MVNHQGSTQRLLGKRLALLGALPLFCVVMLSGCGILQSFGNQPQVFDIPAKYTDLQDRKIAVVVSVTDHTDFRFPAVRETLAEEITRRITANVPGSQVADPSQVLAWQDANPYWGTRPPSMLVKQLGVDRVVLVEVGEYRLHEPGNKHQLRGVISARVNVIEAEAADPDNFGASYPINVMYPDPNLSKIGRVSTNQTKVEQITQYRFCEETSGLFFDHQIVR